MIIYNVLSKMMDALYEKSGVAVENQHISI